MRGIDFFEAGRKHGLWWAKEDQESDKKKSKESVAAPATDSDPRAMIKMLSLPEVFQFNILLNQDFCLVLPRGVAEGRNPKLIFEKEVDFQDFESDSPNSNSDVSDSV